jgi:uncharacterized damage-inducible protein DinB
MPEDLRYPIGKFSPQENYTSQNLTEFIGRIADLPRKLEAAIRDLSESQLDTPYREGGWTVRQVIHHVADSHMNAYIRVKWTLTEDAPVIKAYFEKAWAETPETKADPSLSLNLIKSLHEKWVTLLNGLTPQQLKKAFTHPDTKKLVTLETMMGLYAWHGDHHLEHITSLKRRMGW